MQDILNMLETLRRPRLLMRAARIGADDYNRTVHLPRVLGYGTLPRHVKALVRLMEIEGEMNAQRLEDISGYSLLQHIDVLIALVGEARALRAARAADIQM